MKTIILSLTLMYNAFCMGQIPNIYQDGFGKITYPERSYPSVQLKQYNDTSDAIVERDYDGALIYVKGIIYVRDGFLNKWCLLSSGTIDTIPKWYMHIAGATLTSNPPCYQCLVCVKIFNSIGEAGCIPNEIFDSVTIYGNEEPVYHRKSDTVKVIMLISDTATYYSIKKSSIGGSDWDIDTIGQYKRVSIESVFGYSIIELHSTAEEFDSGMTPKELWGTWWEHISYLDENKIPISKNIIIWQSKEINPQN